jgi:plastocyanin
MRNTTRWAVLAALLLLAPACGDDSSDDAGSTGTTAAGGDDACAASGEDATVTIADFAFDPDSVSVASGGVVAVSNEDGTTHTFTSDEGGFDCSIEAGETANVLVDTAAGDYEFHCTIHPTMTGTITVE